MPLPPAISRSEKDSELFAASASPRSRDMRVGRDDGDHGSREGAPAAIGPSGHSIHHDESARSCLHDGPEEGGHLLDARAPREPVLVRLRELDRRQATVREPRVQVDERGLIASSRRARRRRRRRSRGSAGRPRRRAAPPRGSGDRPRCTRTPSLRGRPCLAPCVRDEQEKRLGVALEPQRARREGGSPRARAGRRARATPPTRDRPGGSRRRIARRRRGRRRGTPAGTGAGRACRRSARVRDPEAVAGEYSSPAKSSKSQPFATTRTLPRRRARAPPPRSPRRHRSRRPPAGDELATCSFAAWRARAAAVSSRRCWFATMGSRRSAIQLLRSPAARPRRRSGPTSGETS